MRKFANLKRCSRRHTDAVTRHRCPWHRSLMDWRTSSIVLKLIKIRSRAHIAGEKHIVEDVNAILKIL